MLAGLTLAILLLTGPSPSLQSVPAASALIKGTVFTPEGRSHRGAKITVTREDADAKQAKKSKKETVSDNLGEFAFRLDSGPAKYRVIIEARGFAVQERDVQITGDERIDISIVLKK